MKLSLVLDNFDAYNRLSQKVLPAPTALRVARALVQLKSEVQSFETARNLLIQQFGKADKDGVVTLEGAAKEGFTKGLQELLDTDIDIRLPSFGMKDFGKAELEPVILTAFMASGTFTEQAEEADNPA